MKKFLFLVGAALMFALPTVNAQNVNTSNELSKLKKEYKLLFPYDAQSSLNSLYKSYSVLSAEYIDSGVLVSAILDEKGKGIYSRYIKSFGGDDNG